MPQVTLLPASATAELLGVTQRTLRRWRGDGGGPPFVRCGPRRIGYPQDALAKWCESRTFNSRAEELSAAISREREAAHA